MVLPPKAGVPALWAPSVPVLLRAACSWAISAIPLIVSP
jgi:hypothetical protein